MNLPNAISIFRLLLVPVFAVLYIGAENQRAFLLAAAVLLLSGLTDAADGYIARRFNKITELGKILDPLADKVTQASVCICLALKNSALTIFPIVFILKELLMVAAGARLLKKGIALESAKWFGKLATIVFYVIMLIIIVDPRLSQGAIIGLLCILIGFMLFSLIMYIPIYRKITRDKKKF